MDKKEFDGLIMALIADKSGHDDVKDSDNMKEDLGFDSLDFVEVVLDIENRTGKQIPDHVIENKFIVRDFIDAAYETIYGGK